MSFRRPHSDNMVQLIIFFIVCTSIFVSSKEVQQACSRNEHLREDKSSKSDYCPGEGGPEPYSTACECDIMYHRLSNGTCIPSRQCPPIPCPENEHFDSCPVCSEHCDNAVASGKRCRPFGRIGITVICQPACRCDETYWRNDENICVYYDECSQYQCE